MKTYSSRFNCIIRIMTKVIVVSYSPVQISLLQYLVHVFDIEMCNKL